MTKSSWRRTTSQNSDLRLEIFRYGVLVFAAVIAVKLFFIQTFQHDFYEALASGQHELFEELIPERGEVSLHDFKDDTLVRVAVNQELAFVYADPREIQEADDTAQALGQALIAGHVEAFKEGMMTSATELGSAYLAEMLQKSQRIQRHLV